MRAHELGCDRADTRTNKRVNAVQQKIGTSAFVKHRKRLILSSATKIAAKNRNRRRRRETLRRRRDEGSNGVHNSDVVFLRRRSFRRGESRRADSTVVDLSSTEVRL